MSTICITHSRDLDGHCSGAIVKKKFPDAEIIGYDYGEPFPWDKVLGNDVIMVDVSLPMDEMARIATEAKEFTWIDHHASAINDYYHSDDLAIDKIIVDLKVGKAACELAWGYFFPGTTLPPAVLLLGTYDVWRNEDKDLWDREVMPFQYGMRQNVNSSSSFPQGLLEYDYELVGMITKNGRVILKYQDIQNKGLMKGAFEAEVRGYRAICCNVGLVNFNSQAFASVFDKSKHDIMVPFCLLSPLEGYRVSFYSEDDGPDVSLIAKSVKGGGGHVHAAGCTVQNLGQILTFFMND